MQFNKQQTGPENTFNLILTNSRVKVITTYKKKQGISSSNGFLVSKNNNIYLVVTKHSLYDDDVDKIKVSSDSIKYTGTYSPASFYTTSNLDVAIYQILRSKYINSSQIINVNQFNYDLTIKNILFSFQFSSTSFFHSSNLEKYNHYEVNEFDKKIKNPSIILNKCSISNDVQNKAAISLCGSMSGTLSVTKNSKIHSMFIGTSNMDFLFLPIFYVEFMISQIENSKKNLGINFFDIELEFTKNNLLKSKQDYSSLKKDDIICKIDGNDIVNATVFVPELETRILIDQYIMLCSHDSFDFTILRNNIPKNILVKSSKVK